LCVGGDMCNNVGALGVAHQHWGIGVSEGGDSIINMRWKGGEDEDNCHGVGGWR
jgi:hypothetical protein